MLNVQEEGDGGKYEKETTIARIMCEADGIIMMVLNGMHGNGFSCQIPPELAIEVPRILRGIADSMEKDIAANMERDRQEAERIGRIPTEALAPDVNPEVPAQKGD